MATVYLHIGTMKTGTSSLQKFLYRNNKVLMTKGYVYPNLNEGYKQNYIARNAHFLVAKTENHENTCGADDEELRKRKFEELGKLAEKYGHIILSDEVIWHYRKNNPEFWKDLTERFSEINCSVKIIVYLRRQDMLAQSLYNQRIKGETGATAGFMEYLEEKRFSETLQYYDYLKDISDQVGKENMIVRVFEKGQFEKGSIFEDFLHCIGLTLTDEYVKEGISVNFALQGNFIEIKKIMDGSPKYSKMNDFLKKEVLSANAAVNEIEEPQKTSLFSYENQVKFLSAFEECNRKIAREFLGREDGVLFYEPVEDLPEWKVNESTMYRDVLLTVLEALCAQEKKMQKLQKSQEQMQKELKAIHNSRIFKICSRFVKNEN